MTPRVLTPDDVVAAAVTVEAALRPVAGRACVELLVHSQHRGFKPQLSLRAQPQPVPASLSATFRVASIAVPPSAAILRSRAST
jgi:hypothetical protein